jgi:putative ABC transport system ATP-binding protein
MSGSTPLIRAEDLTKVYHRGRPDEVVAVNGVSLEVGAGEVVALKGPSGSGKTSLLSLIGCMARPTAGRLEVAGRDVAKLSEQSLTEVRRQGFGFVFQQFHLIPGISVLDNVMLPLVPNGHGFGEMRRRAETVLGDLDLGGKQGRRVGRLSGGEQQRVAIARALITDPQVVVADEPTAHLDRRLSFELMEILAHLNRDGRTIVIATHDPLVFDHPLIDRCLSLRDGRLDTGAQP